MTVAGRVMDCELFDGVIANVSILKVWISKMQKFDIFENLEYVALFRLESKLDRCAQ